MVSSIHMKPMDYLRSLDKDKRTILLGALRVFKENNLEVTAIGDTVKVQKNGDDQEIHLLVSGDKEDYVASIETLRAIDWSYGLGPSPGNWGEVRNTFRSEPLNVIYYSSEGEASTNAPTLKLIGRK